MTITVTAGEVADHMSSQGHENAVLSFREIAYNKVWPVAHVLPQAVRNWVQNQNFLDEHYSRMLTAVQEQGDASVSIDIEVPEDVA